MARGQKLVKLVPTEEERALVSVDLYPADLPAVRWMRAQHVDAHLENAVRTIAELKRPPGEPGPSAHVLDHYVKPHREQLQDAMACLDNTERATAAG